MTRPDRKRARPDRAFLCPGGLGPLGLSPSHGDMNAGEGSV
jgi:hypothetical protein